MMLTIELYMFYGFAALLLFAASMVIRVQNPVHAVLFLVLVFCLNSCLLFLIGAEFLSLLLLVVYVGAIAILFLFVVMMLPIKNQKISTTLQNIPIGVMIGFIFAVVLIMIISTELPSINKKDLVYPYLWTMFDIETGGLNRDGTILRYIPFEHYQPQILLYGKENAKAFGILLYTNNFYYVLIAGLILLLGIVGAVMLTRHELKKSYKQEIHHQMSRRSFNAILKAKINS
jgi:NADH-quinone oxidoreductase subunit J